MMALIWPLVIGLFIIVIPFATIFSVFKKG
jgi:uncharacterized membrane protein